MKKTITIILFLAMCFPLINYGETTNKKIRINKNGFSILAGTTKVWYGKFNHHIDRNDHLYAPPHGLGFLSR